MKSAREWLEIRTYALRDGDDRVAHLLTWIGNIQRDSFDAGRVAGINEAASMCGGDGHIEEGVLSLLTKDTPWSKNTP